jgi:hypothetical protein
MREITSLDSANLLRIHAVSMSDVPFGLFLLCSSERLTNDSSLAFALLLFLPVLS